MMAWRAAGRNDESARTTGVNIRVCDFFAAEGLPGGMVLPLYLANGGTMQRYMIDRPCLAHRAVEKP